MKSSSFIISYLTWHYSKAFLNIYGIFSNFLWSINNFFSIPILLKTLISPWRHLDERPNKNSSIGDYFGDLVVNTIMRIIGMIARLMVICIGLLCLILILFAEIISFIVWTFMPLIILAFLFEGFSKISANI